MKNEDTFDHRRGDFISAGEARIYYEEIGKPDLPVLLLLHGGFGSVEDFNRIAPALSRQFRLIAVDSRGHGKSTLGGASLSYRLLTEDLARVIDALRVPSFSILGFSDGGIVAYRYAVKNDQRLDKIVTVGASWEMAEDDPAWEMLSGMTGQMWREMFPSSYDKYMRYNPEPDFDRFARAVVGMWTDLGPDGYPFDQVREIKNEMLIVRGDNDPLTSVNSLEKLRRIAQNASLFNIPFAEHVAFCDYPEIFFPVLNRFLGVPVDPVNAIPQSS